MKIPLILGSQRLHNMALMSKSLSVIIPAYNEEDSLRIELPLMVEFCSRHNYQLIIVNDGSKDKTAEVCKEYFQHDHFTLISHKVNRGYGAAIKTGIVAAKTDLIITIDADGQHTFEDVVKLHRKLEEEDADMVVGSRHGQRSASLYRGLGKKLIRMTAKFLVEVPIKDLNSGMKIYRTDLAKRYIKFCPDAMPYSDVIGLVFVHFRHRVVEEPIIIKDRVAGKSTISTITAIQTVRELVNMVFLINPLKVFFTLFICMLSVSLFWGVPILVRGQGVSVGTLLGILISVLLILIGFVAEQISQIRKSNI
ncbi:MAG: glycosyltransferase family 2 protein [Flavobacteriales bacterium]|nr:glycosyltransferase family 2 protein [Flavobacteriales bacterium]